MYIAPNSTVRILRGVPLTPDYKDTLYFGSLSEQTSYFMSKTVATFNSQSYVRPQRGMIKLEAQADAIYSAGYLMYQNTSYGSKWFYAFITSIEWDNNSTAIITFEQDDLQTWLFAFSTPPCLVERCHSFRDNIGDNIVPEPVDPGDLVPNNQTGIHAQADPNGQMSDPYIFISFVDPEDDQSKGKLINGIFTTGVLYPFDCTTQGLDACKDFLYDVSAQYFDSIVAIYMAPHWALGEGAVPSWLANSPEGAKYTRTLSRLTSIDKLDGYTPRNNKMYTYPYNCLTINTASGNNMTVRYEFFDNFTPTFEETWVVLEPVSAVLRPTNYRGIRSSAKDMALTLNDFPMCMWSGDAYKAYLAQNQVSRGASILEILGGVLAAPFTGGTSLVATAHGITNLVNSDYKASIAADQRGGQAAGNNPWCHDQMDFYASRMSCTHDKAVMIDDYFTAYGYAQGEIMRPPTHWRKAFTYVKTDGCIVTGNLPSDAAARIRGIYDAGIRWWADHNNFGNLHIDNYCLN